MANINIPFSVNDNDYTNREKKAKDAELLVTLSTIADALTSIADSLSSDAKVTKK
jgi:hypothetical protein